VCHHLGQRLDNMGLGGDGVGGNHLGSAFPHCICHRKGSLGYLEHVTSPPSSSRSLRTGIPLHRARTPCSSHNPEQGVPLRSHRYSLQGRRSCTSRSWCIAHG